jgi:DNA-binding protein HU-beta
MNHAEFIDAIASKAGQPKTTLRQGLRGLIETATETLARGDSVTVPGFGTFTCVQREARPGRDPATGETIIIGPSTEPRFVPGKTLKDTIKG